MGFIWFWKENAERGGVMVLISVKGCDKENSVQFFFVRRRDWR